MNRPLVIHELHVLQIGPRDGSGDDRGGGIVKREGRRERRRGRRGGGEDSELTIELQSLPSFLNGDIMIRLFWQ